VLVHTDELGAQALQVQVHHGLRNRERNLAL
jgi:hypothetical protein